MGKSFSRKVSVIERLWLVAEKMCPLVMNQMVVEGRGKIDPEDLKRAIEKASAANPGSRLVLKGFLHTCRWIDSEKTPPLREANGSRWSGKNSEDAPFFQVELSSIDGPSCEVVLIHGDPMRIAFRTHHAVMDGRGTLIWAEDIFRVLRGEEPLGAYSKITEWELARTFQKEYRTPLPHDNLAVSGKPQGNEKGVLWRRAKIRGKFPKLVAQVSYLAAQEAWRYSDGKVRLSIPVDIRQRKPGLRSTANLTMAVYIEVKPKDTVDDIANEIFRQLEEKRDGQIDRWDFLYKFVPLWFLINRGNARTAKKHKKGIYSLSGIVTNPGRVPLESFVVKGFKPESVFFIPPAFEYIPSVITLSGTSEGIEILISMPKRLASNGRLDAALNRIVSGLKPA